MEWGPRALGNRSILCDPRRGDIRDILNAKIKRRESFRPFAPAVLREHAAAWSRQSDIPIDVRVRGERATPLEVEQALYRVAQEALANVARHSRASAASLELAWQDGAVTLRVADDGRGFAPAEVRGDGYGLSSMSERVAALGGRVTVESAPGQGTRVTCTCPLDGGHEGRAGAGWPHR
jgi:signal transduction histidine kinase